MSVSTSQDAAPQESHPTERGAPDLPTFSVSAIVERLEGELARALEGGPERGGEVSPILAFDADGTLWDADVGVLFFEALIERSGVREVAREELAAEVQRFGIEVTSASQAPSALDLARALHQAFLAGLYPDDRAYAIHAWAFAGWTEGETNDFAAEVIQRFGLAARLRGALKPLFAWGARRGVDTYIVSASPTSVVRVGAALLGVPPERVIAMKPAATGGIIEPRLAGPIVYGPGKVDALMAARPGALLLGAFGDSAWDASLLRASRVPVAVCPTAGLMEVAASIPGLAVIET